MLGREIDNDGMMLPRRLSGPMSMPMSRSSSSGTIGARASGRRRFSLSAPQSMLLAWLPEYLQRIYRFDQMDFEFACSQLVSLCGSPSAVYRSTLLRKQIKNQWARDDPAFVTILLGFMTVSAVAFSVAFGWSSPLHFIRLVLGAVLLDFLGFGCVIATFGWWFANRYLRILRVTTMEQSVEWLYAFDIHCNAFFPVFLVLYVVQFYLSPFLLSSSVFATIVANTLYAGAFCYYHYLSFLGYNALPFLHKTEQFLYPIGAISVLYLTSIVLGRNLSHMVLQMYFGR